MFMKIAILADMHLGYGRFEEDSFKQAEYALKDAEKKADILIIAGDIFDVKIPKFETIKRVADIFSTIKKPVYTIHGNHERRGRDMVNPLEFLCFFPNVHYFHGKTEIIKAGDEEITITFMGSVPEEFAKTNLNKLVQREPLNQSLKTFKILVIHQSIKEFVYQIEEELCLDDLRDLPFDLIINGHIHQYTKELNGGLIIPGSTVITQLKKDEQGKRGYVLYDTQKKEHEFIPINSRLFFYKEFVFEDASLVEVKEKIENWINKIKTEHKDAILKIKLCGTLKKDLTSTNISLVYSDGIYLQNNLNNKSTGEKIKKLQERNNEKILIKERILSQFNKKLKGKISLFEPIELFEKLSESSEQGMEYLKSVSRFKSQPKEEDLQRLPTK